MARPTVPAVTEHWYDELKTTQPGDEGRDWPFLKLLGGMGAAFGPLHDIVRDTADGPGWTILFDPARCPAWALPWLAQFAGVQLPEGITEAEQRQRIVSPPAFERGTLAGMRAAVSATLTGTRFVRILERNGTPYQLAVVSRTPETPDPAASERAARSQKPAGLILTYVVSDVPIIDEGSGTIDSIPGGVTIDSTTTGDW